MTTCATRGGAGCNRFRVHLEERLGDDARAVLLRIGGGMMTELDPATMRSVRAAAAGGVVTGVVGGGVVGAKFVRDYDAARRVFGDWVRAGGSEAHAGIEAVSRLLMTGQTVSTSDHLLSSYNRLIKRATTGSLVTSALLGIALLGAGTLLVTELAERP